MSTHKFPDMSGGNGRPKPDAEREVESSQSSRVEGNQSVDEERQREREDEIRRTDKVTEGLGKLLDDNDCHINIEQFYRNGSLIQQKVVFAVNAKPDPVKTEAEDE